MKKLIIVTVMALCFALCAAVWPQGETVGETHHPTQELTVNAPEAHAVMRKEGTEDLSQTEEEKAEPPQPEPPLETVPDPKPRNVCCPRSTANPGTKPDPEADVRAFPGADDP